MSDLLNSASLVMIPSGYKEDTVFSAIPTDGSGDLSFTRASNGTRVNSAGLVEVCPWNLLEQSETIGTSPWNVSGYALTSNATTAPNGTNTAELFTLNNGNVAGASYSINQGLPISGAITISVYFKNNNSTGKYVLQTGSAQGSDINVVTLAITNFGTGCIGSVESVGNGWYRFSTFIPSASSPYFFSYQDGMTGDGSKGIYLWGAQINYGALKPYFPTTDRLNVPRLTYQNGGGGCPSLLLEKQSTNELTYSEQIQNADWNVIGGDLVVTANAVISPDGTQNAGAITLANSANRYFVHSILGLTGGVPYTYSVYMKSASGNLSINMGGVNGLAGVMKTVTTEWQRFTYTFTPATSYGEYFGFDNRGAGSSTSGTLYFWGAQIEQSSYPTSYIPTTTASATRVADACSKTGISSLIGQTEGVLFVDFEFTAYDGTAKWIAFLGGGANYIGLYANNSTNIVGEVFNTTSQFSGAYSFSVGQRYKIAIAYKANDFVYYINGAQISTASSGTIPTTSDFTFLYSTTNDRIGGKVYNQLCLFKTRLTNAELASLTTI